MADECRRAEERSRRRGRRMHDRGDDHERQHRHRRQLPAVQRSIGEVHRGECVHQQRRSARARRRSASRRHGSTPAAFALHGRHTNAAPAPSSSPLERVNVDRYKKLVRSDVNALGRRQPPRDQHHHDRGDRGSIDRSWPMRLLRRVISTKASGHIKYHCSSTARLHRWRSGEKLPKY